MSKLLIKQILTLLCFVICLNLQAQKDIYQEPFRPQFHFTPAEKWMNDPNGLVYLNGKYHLFYQYYPKDVIWGPMHWGHAVSTDLLNWKHKPVALYPDSLGNIFSGSVVIDKNNTAGFGANVMVAIFTYHNDAIWEAGQKNTESQALAYSTDEGKTWTKYANNPVLNNSGEQDFRDPKVFWNESKNKWDMVLAAGDRIKIYSSENLKNWTFESDFKPTIDDTDLGVWECPDLFKMKVGKIEKWVMIVSHGDKASNGGSGTRYFVGDYDGKTFTNTQKAIWLDYGTDAYAGVTFSNVPNNKKILLAWMSNWQYANKTPTEVWRGAMTLPRELFLHPSENKESFFLTQTMIEQFSLITQLDWSTEETKTPFVKNDVDLSQAEIKFKIKETEDLQIVLSNALQEKLVIQIKNNQVTINRSQSGKTDFSEQFAAKEQLMPIQDKIHTVQLILDKSSIEILLNNGKYSMTNLVFPTLNYSTLQITSPKKQTLKELTFQKIRSVWR
jgi:fructan beta-fructosidase